MVYRLRAAWLWGVVGAYETWYANQSLSHDGGVAWYLERVLVNRSFWRSPQGPVLFYTGNEGSIDSFYEANGWMREVLAPELGALLVFAEARYYGHSDPGDANKTWLSTELILADYAGLLAALGLPAVAFGGSYGGTLTSFLRRAYPSLTVGGVASSAPIGYYDVDRWPEFGVTEFSWAQQVERSYGECLDAIETAIDTIRASPRAAAQAFGVCEPQGLGPSDPAQLFQYALESLPQLDYQYSVDSRPANPVATACALLSSVEPLAAAANVTRMVLGCIDGCIETLPEGPGGVPGDGPGPGSWGKQSCTQTLHRFSSDSPIREYRFNQSQQDAVCSSLYGVKPDAKALTATYGGYDLPLLATNLFFSNGGKDPWMPGGFLPNASYATNSSNTFCFMPNAAHHLDLRAPKPSQDPSDVVECRNQAKARIIAWLNQSSSSSVDLHGFVSPSRFICAHNCEGLVFPGLYR